MLARCSILERLSSRSLQGASHSALRHTHYTPVSPILSRPAGTRPSYDLLRIGGVRHYAIRSKEKRKAIREARSPPKPHEEPSMEYISSWDLEKDTLLYVRVEDSSPSDSSTSSSGGSGTASARNRWPTISTLDPNLIGPADYVNISNMDRPKIICHDGREMVSCVVEYGRKKIRKAKTMEKKDSSKTAAPSASSSRGGAEKASEPEPPPPPPPPRQHPLSDGDYVDSLLPPHESYQPEGVAQAGTSSSTSHEAPPSSSSHPDLDTPRPTPDSSPLTLLAGREQGRAEPELSDPSFRSLLSQERKRLRKVEDGWKRSEEKERMEREADLQRTSEAGMERDGRGVESSREGKKSGRVKRGRSRSRERVGERKDKGKDGKKAGKAKNAEPAPTYERIPFPPGTKGFFYFYKPSTPAPSPSPSTTSPSSSPTSSSPSISTSTRPTANNHAQTQTPSPASGALRFRVLPLPLTDPRAFEESYDLPGPYGAVAGPWEVPLLVLRERGGMEVPEGERDNTGERVGARGPMEGFWRLLFKNASAASSSSSASPPTTAASATGDDASQSLSTPSKPSQAHPALLTPSEASQIDSLLPPYMPRIGPHTKVLQSVLDPFVMDLSVDDMSVVVVDALRRGPAPSTSAANSASKSSPSAPSNPASSASSQPSAHEHEQPHRIHYTKFENMLVPLSWSHHRGPYTYNTPAHIPISKRFMTDRPALKTLLWKRRRKSPWTGQALVRFELTPPPTSKSIHAHPLLGLRILKYIVPPDPQPVWKRPKPQVVGRLVSRWKPQGRMHLSPWHPQRVRYPFPEEVMQVLKERYWKPEWVEGRTRRRGVSYRERKAKEVREGRGGGIKDR
ncbi:hypothetical protein BKA70DRAFT_1320285, partial [Coprinopsis sp. MPI-PUGE-AT-0042]